MLRNTRSDFQSMNVSPNVSLWAVAAIAGVLSIGLGGCSADVLRFDAPVLGYKKSAGGPPPASLHPDRTLFDQSPPSSAGAPYPAYGNSAPPATTGNVVTAELPAPPRSEPRTHRPAPNGRATPAPRYAPTTSTPRKRTALLAPRRTTPYQARPPQIERPAPDMPESIVVRPGDTLYELSRRYGITVADIKDANGLTNTIIKPGQRLALRPDYEPETQAPRKTGPRRYKSRTTQQPSYGQQRRVPLYANPGIRTTSSDDDTYTIRPGDSLYGISRRTGVKVAALKRINGITNARRLRPGTVLRLRQRVLPVTPHYQTARRRLPQQRSPRLEPRRYAGARQTEPRIEVTQPRMEPTSSARPRILNPTIAPHTTSRRVRSVRIPVTKQSERRTKPRTYDRVAGLPQSKPPPRTVASGKFRWPVRGRIVRGFGKRPDGTKNDGVDIAVPIGSDVHAAETGVVAYAGDELKGYGNLILIRHEGGWVSAYAHNDLMMVKRGDTIRRGQVIAKAGKTGNVTQPILHFELRKGSKPVNPLPHLARL